MSDMAPYPTDVSIITTYRCQMRCKMCDIWENPTDKKQEITAKELEILPAFKFVNVTGGEPFVRRDLADIVEVLFKKSERIVISTSGWHTDRVIKMAERFPSIGIRVSIEGLAEKNDELRGRDGSFDRQPGRQRSGSGDERRPRAKRARRSSHRPRWRLWRRRSSDRSRNWSAHLTDCGRSGCEQGRSAQRHASISH